jgi:drug/metabolite transporter (DMT)-like permease
VSNSSDPDYRTGALFLIAGFAIIPFMDGAAKQLAQLGYAPVLIAWARFSVAALVLSPMLLRRGNIRQLWAPGAGLQILRATFLAAATVLYFSAIETMPIADALAVYFVYPFLMTAMAPLILKESVGIKRFTAVIIGFAGSLLIIRPGFDVVPIGIYYVLIASVCFALFNLLTRKLKGQSDPWFTVFYQSLVGTVVLAVFVPGNWTAPTSDAWALMGVLIAAAIIGHWLVVRAFDYAPASFLAPFGYFEMIAAVAIGYFWFGDFPDEFTWAGIAVIASAGIYISRREKAKGVI